MDNLPAEIKKQGDNLASMIAEKLPHASFLRDSQSQILAPWQPALRDMADDVSSSWRRAAAMTIDALHNSGWMAGGVEHASVESIGDGLVLNAQPDVKALGWDEEFRAEWCSIVESRWEDWSNDPYQCDMRGRATISEMTDTMIKWYYGYGEGFAWLQRANRRHVDNKLKVKTVQPHRCPLESDVLKRLCQGVFVDNNGMALGYRFKLQGKFGEVVDVDLPVFDRQWRQQVIHVFDGDKTHVRGITPLAPILKVLRQYDQLSDATLTTALMQTVLAATITSNELPGEIFDTLNGEDDEDPLGDAAGFMAAKLAWASRTNIDVGEHGKVVNLFPGEKLELNSVNAPGNNYEKFVVNLLREIAVCMGITYEALTQDFTSATYSSVRMGVSTVWPKAKRRRKFIAVPFVKPIYAHWLMEEIASGRIPFPGGYQMFMQKRSAAIKAKWNGPGKPSADEFKSAKASTERIENGTSTITQECAEDGRDVETMVSQIANEVALFNKHNLQHPSERQKVAKQPTKIEKELEEEING